MTDDHRCRLRGGVDRRVHDDGRSVVALERRRQEGHHLRTVGRRAHVRDGRQRAEL